MIRSLALSRQFATLKIHAQESTVQLSDLCELIAQTSDDMARVYDTIAATGSPATAARVAKHAQRLRRFAEHERLERQRWADEPKGRS